MCHDHEGKIILADSHSHDDGMKGALISIVPVADFAGYFQSFWQRHYPLLNTEDQFAHFCAVVIKT